MLSVSSSFWLVLAFLLRILYFLCSHVLYLSSMPFQVGQCMSLLWILIVRYRDSMSSSPMVIGYGLTWFHRGKVHSSPRQAELPLWDNFIKLMISSHGRCWPCYSHTGWQWARVFYCIWASELQRVALDVAVDICRWAVSFRRRMTAMKTVMKLLGASL